MAEQGPSFDCRKAATSIEKQICSSSELSRMDKELSGKYQEFLAQLDDTVAVKAKAIQRRWLKNRNIACSSEPVRFEEFGLTQEFDRYFFTTPESCLKIYYQESIDALNKGLIVTKEWLYDRRKSRTLGFLGEASLRYVEEYKEYGESKGVWVISMNETEYIVGHHDFSPGNSGWQSDTVFFNIYMAASGVFFASVVDAGSIRSGRGDCYVQNSYQLSFIRDLKSLSPRVEVESVIKAGGPQCEQSKRILGWSFGGDDELYFTSRTPLTGKSRLMTKDRFYEYSLKKIQDGELVKIRTLNFEESHPVALKSGLEIEKSLAKDYFTKASNDICETVSSGMDLAYQLYNHDEIQKASVNYWLGTMGLMVDLGKYQDTALYRTALVFKEYLHAIKQREQWQSDLWKARHLYDYPLYSGAPVKVYDNDKYRDPYHELGFPSLYNCPPGGSYLRYPEKSLDEQIYSFWVRRNEDRTLKYFEALLEWVE
jgi:uncharacterized protein YecT (DUF1311 family)